MLPNWHFEDFSWNIINYKWVHSNKWRLLSLPCRQMRKRMIPKKDMIDAMCTTRKNHQKPQQIQAMRQMKTLWDAVRVSKLRRYHCHRQHLHHPCHNQPQKANGSGAGAESSKQASLGYCLLTESQVHAEINSANLYKGLKKRDCTPLSRNRSHPF